jgi:hypothetical protein
MKEKILSISFVLFLVTFLVLNVFIKDIDVSNSERRKLEKFPKISIEDIMDGSFMENLDLYTVDQFVFRDTFRTIKANINYNIFKKIDNNGIYVIDDHIFKSEYPTNIKSIDNFIEKINLISSFLSPKNKVYYAIIPDKNYYINNSKYLNMDYDLIYEKIREINHEYIELRDVLTLNDYYRTDTHWKQENLSKVVDKLGKTMGLKIKSNYVKKYYYPFYGVYYGQSALNINPDKIVYLTNEVIENSKVYYLEDQKNDKVYTLDKLENLDKYDVYLGGASSFIEITNEDNKTGRELVMFRDSFGSSLAPLLIDSYSKITLIDIRYINSDTYLKMINFKNQDVLFVYSTLIVNNSTTLKK